MLKNLLIVGISVSNQDEAIDFYVNKLGLEKRTDVPMSEGMRWIEVAPPGAQTALVLAKEGCGGDQGRIGQFTGHIFATDDIQTTYETLKSRGVHFTEPPSTTVVSTIKGHLQALPKPLHHEGTDRPVSLTTTVVLGSSPGENGPSLLTRMATDLA